MILLGAHNISKFSESGRQSISVKSVHVHDKWNPATEDYDGDIAVLKLTETVKFNNYVRPVCLADFAVSPGISGAVIGWGYHSDKDAVSNVPRKIILPVLDDRECFKKDPLLTKIIWNEAFCAGKAGAGVCKGDSGSGFYVGRAGKIYLSGIVSSSITRACSLANFALYADVFKYSTFINQVSDMLLTLSPSTFNHLKLI